MGLKRILMMLSAPLMNIRIVPLSLIMTLIRLRVESNSNDLSNLTFLSLLSILNSCSLAEAPLNWKPSRAAASTSVISSGEGP